jgi:hypothetical protein
VADARRGRARSAERVRLAPLAPHRRDPDPTRSRDHVVLSIFAERRRRANDHAGVEALLEDVRTRPVDVVGAMPINEFMPKRERTALATALNALHPLLAARPHDPHRPQTPPPYA